MASRSIFSDFSKIFPQHLLGVSGLFTDNLSQNSYICCVQSTKIQKAYHKQNTVFSRFNAPGVYLKLGLRDPAFNRGPAFINEVKFSSFFDKAKTTNKKNAGGILTILTTASTTTKERVYVSHNNRNVNIAIYFQFFFCLAYIAVNVTQDLFIKHLLK